MGAFGFVFSDFGKAFSVRDLNGEAPTSRIITDVSGSDQPIIDQQGCGRGFVLRFRLAVSFYGCALRTRSWPSGFRPHQFFDGVARPDCSGSV